MTAAANQLGSVEHIVVLVLENRSFDHILGFLYADSAWPGDRFDVIWTFTVDPAAGRYGFGQVPQQLLVGDTDTVISDNDTGSVS